MNEQDNHIDQLLEKLGKGELTSEEAALSAQNGAQGYKSSQEKPPSQDSSLEKRQSASSVGNIEANPEKVAERSLSTDQLEDRILSYIIRKISHYLDKDVSMDVSIEKNFMDLGVDSSQLIELAQHIEQEQGIELYPTLFFEHQNIKDLTKYFAEEHSKAFSEYFQINEDYAINDKKTSVDKKILPVEADLEESQVNAISPPRTPSETASQENSVDGGIDQKEPPPKQEIRITPSTAINTSSDTRIKEIAIIGMAGKVAESDNLYEFWGHIQASKDLIKEIPLDRWDYRPWFSDDLDASNKTYSKWGSFLDDADKFDPVFFGISGREAIWLDPQLRLLLQVVQETIEDAGYAQKISGTKTGVYMGVMFQEYWDEIVRAHLPITDYEPSSNPMSSLSARISYTFDLQGPSIPLDNACASSLTAMHLACKALQGGECDMAFVAGTNLLLSPLHYVNLSRMRAFSPTGRCHTFDKAADGYVPGEGVIALLLKPLSKAIKDRDNIHAIIKGTAINHGGRSNNPTSPRPELQTRLLISSWEDAGINPETISYLEAHGTGTKLGDPIEINALKKAFKEFTDKKNFCAIGSTKAHIGHLEGAAGVASVVKVILSMKNRLIPAMPNFRELNPYIQLQDSPFYINTSLQTWDTEPHVPRRAGISSFGMFGNNAHVVIEEFIPTESKQSGYDLQTLPISMSHIFLLSALNEERLRSYSERMAAFLERNPSMSLADITYTMQVGRGAMEERLAVLISIKKDLIDKLSEYAQGKSGIENLYKGNTKADKTKTGLLIEGKEGDAFIRIVMEERKLAKIAQLWVSGVEMDWRLLHQGQAPKIVSLPTYPFSRERYWMPEPKEAIPINQNGNGRAAKLHPLIDENISILYEGRFLTCLKGDEFFLEDHIVGGEKVLPGVACIEMARAAGEIAGERKVKSVKNIVWTRPVTIKEAPQNVHISLHPNQDVIEYEISSKGGDGQRVVHSQGKLVYENHTDSPHETEIIDIRAIEERCPVRMPGDDCYKLFQTKHLQYGPCFQAIQMLLRNETEAISRLALPKPCQDGFRDFVLHPSLMDAALQTAMGLMDAVDSGGLYLPFSLGEVELIRPLPETCYAYVTLAENQQGNDQSVKRFHILLLDESGLVLARMKDFSARAIKQHRQLSNSALSSMKALSIKASSSQSLTPSILYYHNVWESSEIDAQTLHRGLSGESGQSGHVLIFDANDDVYNALKERLTVREPGRAWDIKVILVKPGQGFKDSGNHIYEIDPARKEQYDQLLNSLKNQDAMPHIIFHLWAKGHFVSSEEAMHAQLERGVYSLFYLSQALMDLKPRDKIKIVHAYLSDTGEPQPLCAALSGLAKTVQRENPKFLFEILEIQTPSAAQSSLHLERMVEILLSEAQTETDGEVEVRYTGQGEQRWVKRLQEFDLDAETAREKTDNGAVSLKEKGVYVITGGAGGLGLIFAKYLARQVKARLVLTGRSELSDDKRAKIKELESLGSEIMYIKADISKREDAEKMITEAKSRFGKIHGIIHSAGVIRDAFIIRKTKEDMDAVLAPKVFGTVYLDEATREEELDFFVLFSSIAGSIGNAGQCDYAYANSFMDNFSQLRECLRRKGSCSGKTLSIIWPLWREGGMKVDEATEKMLAKTTGMWPLRAETGLSAFVKGLASEENQFLVIEGDHQKLRGLLGKGDERPQQNSQQRDECVKQGDASGTPLASNQGDLLQYCQKDLVKIVSEILKINETGIDLNKDMNEYGFDSITLTDLTNRINEKYRLGIAVSVFFEHPSISASANYLCNEYKDSFLHHYRDTSRDSLKMAQNAAQEKQSEPAVDKVKPGNYFQPHDGQLHDEKKAPQGNGLRKPEYSPAIIKFNGNPFEFNAIFLTGATGILGGYILKEVLETTNSQIYCLIRANDAAHAQERLRKILAIYGTEDRVLSELNHRVIPMIGDVSKENLGLPANEYQRLSESTDFTIHAAASTNLMMPYQYLAPLNVQGVKNIIDLVLKTRQKYMVYVSSYHVMANLVFKSDFVFKEQDFDLGQTFTNMGYQQTKFEAERLVREASQKGLIWNIVRPGNIFGEQKRGFYPLEMSGSASIFYKLLEVIIKSGITVFGNNYYDITPVDYIARSILFLGLKRDSFFETYHLLNTDKKRWHEIIDLLNDYGYKIKFASVDDYSRMVHQNSLPLNEEADAKWLSLMKSSFLRKEFFINDAYADASYTKSIVEGEGILCPKIDLKLMGAYLEYCISKGIIPPPPQHNGQQEKQTVIANSKKPGKSPGSGKANKSDRSGGSSKKKSNPAWDSADRRMI